MLASVLSSFHDEKSFVDDFSYQSFVVHRLMILKNTKIIPIGTEIFHFEILDYKNSFQNEIIKDRIQKQVNSSECVFIAIDRGMDSKMIARVITAEEHNKHLKLYFFTLHGSNTLIGEIVNDINKNNSLSNVDKISIMIKCLKKLSVKNKNSVTMYSDYTGYKVLFYKFIQEYNLQKFNRISELSIKKTFDS